MHFVLFLLLVFTFSLSAAEPPTAREPAVTWSAVPLLPKVNIINGSYIDEVCDFTVAGAEPLSLTRFYNHLASDNKAAGNWLFNPESYAIANFEYGGLKLFVSVGEKDGTLYTYENKEGQSYRFNPLSPEYLGRGGGCHPLNTHIIYHKQEGPYCGRGTERPFSWIGEIQDGAGNVRCFSTPDHWWLKELRESKHKKHPPTEWTPYSLQITEEKKANGNRIVYTPETISAYNSASELMGQIKLERKDSTLTVLGSDGRKATLIFVNNRIASVEASGKIPLKYHYNEKGYLHKVEYLEGHSFITEYYPDNKVKAQYDGGGNQLGRFEYSEGLTTLYDGENNKTLFHYDKNKRITSIERYQGNVLFSEEKCSWDSKTGNLLCKTVGNLRKEEYKYDKNQNLIEECMSGEGGSYTRYYTYSDDGLNLKLSESDDSGTTIRFTYKPRTNILTAELVYEGERIRKRKFFTYDESAICIKQIEDDGISEESTDLTSVIYRKIIYIHPKESLPCYGLPELIEEKTVDRSGLEILLSSKYLSYHPSGKIEKEKTYYTATDPTTIVIEYDQRERPIAKILSGASTNGEITLRYSYDENDNLLTLLGPRADQERRWSYDVANRPIKEETSGLITQKSYDKLGRVSAEIDPCGNATHYNYNLLGQVTEIRYPDGSILLREYDPLGNLLYETDPNGYKTGVTYDFRGKPTVIYHPDGSFETFTYYSDGACSAGALATHRDKKGAVTRFTYDLFHNPIKVEIYDAQGELLKSHTSTYTPFTLLSKTDAEGETTYYTYDFAGRKLSEKHRDHKIAYSYDGASRVIRIEEGGLTTLNSYNCFGYLIEKETSCTWGLLRKESYRYDKAGNRIEVKNSKGSTTTLYDAHGKVIEIKKSEGTATHITRSYVNYTKTIIDPLGIKTIHIHDSLGREVEKIVRNSSGQIIKRQTKKYDPASNLIELSEDVYAGTTSLYTLTNKWEYGPLGRVEKATEADKRITRYTYQEDGTFYSTIKPDGIELIHTYDALGRLKRLHSSSGDIDYHYSYSKNDQLLTLYDALSKTTTIRSYDLYGHLTQETLGNKIALRKNYDPLGRRTSTTLPDETKIEYSYKGRDLDNVRYLSHTFTYRSRDEEGLPTAIDLPIGTLTIERDALSNIRRYEVRNIPLLLSSFQEPYYYRMREMQYDDNQNLIHALTTTDLHFNYDPFNQLTSENGYSYEYDSLHNRFTEKSDPLCQLSPPNLFDQNGYLLTDGRQNYTYDSLGRLTALSIGKSEVHYTYDGFDRRLTKKIYTNHCLIEEYSYMWDEDSEIGALQSNKITQLRIIGENDLLYKLSGSTYYPLLDPFGNVVTLVNQLEHKPIESYDYTAFGVSEAQGHLSPWRFSGKRMDYESGLLYFGRRYYSPYLGRFLTPDAAELTDSLNPYTFAQNNPLKYQDPNGEFSFLSSIVGAIIGGISSGIHSHWKLSAILKGAAIGAAAGFVGNFMGGTAYWLSGNHGQSLLMGGIVGGASGGTVGGGLSAAAFGGNVWHGIGHGAFSGALSGGFSSAFIAFDILNSFAITGGGALSSLITEGPKGVGPGALYSLGGSLLSNTFTIFGAGAEGRVPEQWSDEWYEMKNTDSTCTTTPELNFREDYNQNHSFGKNVLGYTRSLLIALAGDGSSHVWHTRDWDYSTEKGVNDGYVPERHYYKLITRGVSYPEQDYARGDWKHYDLFENSCTSRFKYLHPARYYADYHYPELGPYWWRRR